MREDGEDRREGGDEGSKEGEGYWELPVITLIGVLA